MRKNNWNPRTKKEGPKKISDIHREASMELEKQVGVICMLCSECLWLSLIACAVLGNCAAVGEI